MELKAFWSCSLERMSWKDREYWLESRQTKQSNGGTGHMTREQVAEGKVLTELFRN